MLPNTREKSKTIDAKKIHIKYGVNRGARNQESNAWTSPVEDAPLL